MLRKTNGGLFYSDVSANSSVYMVVVATVLHTESGMHEGDDKRNKKPCSHCGSEKHTYNTCWKKFPWLKDHKCEKCGRTGHRQEHCTKRSNNDQNNISIDVMMNMVDVEEKEIGKDESKEMWERLNNVFGKPWYSEENNEKGHTDHNDYDSENDSVENDDDSTYVDDDEEGNEEPNEVIDLTQSNSNDNENDNEEEENNEDENDSVEVIEQNDDETVDTVPINYDDFEEEKYPDKRDENNELTQEEW